MRPDPRAAAPQRLAEPEACSSHAAEPLRFPMPRRDPMHPPPDYAAWGGKQRVSRVVQWNGAPAWFITGYDDIRTLLNDPRLSSDATHPAYPAQNAALTIIRRDYQVFSQMDPPDHTAERKLVAEEFSPQNIKRLQPKVQALIDRLIGDIVAKPPAADLVADFAMPLPCQVVCSLLGVPDSDREAIQNWSKELSSLSTPPEVAAAKITDFCEGYLTRLVKTKRQNPDDGLLSRLILGPVDQGTIPMRKVVSLARLFLNAGHESTTSTLGLGLAALLYHPGQLDLLRRDPTLIRNAIEEILRFTDVTHSGRLRVAREDILIDDVTIRAGDAVIMHQPTADREEAKFENPNEFDITRKPRQHLAFGSGIHHCIGQPLARMELQLGIGTLVARLPGLRPSLAIEDLRFHGRQAIYGLESLPVIW